jgi:transcription termination/antitermination protein NusG
MLRWYCARAKPTRQRAAVDELAGLGFRAWYPVFADGKPVFGRYTFVQFDIAIPTWPEIERARTMTSHALVSFGNGPTPLPIGTVERMLERGPLEVLRAAKRIYQKGESVKLLTGPFAGMTGAVETSLGERITILMGLMTGRIPVTVRADQVESLSASTAGALSG